MTIIGFARWFAFVREAQELGQNQGLRVNAIQVWGGGASAIGSSWCAWWLTMIFDIYYRGRSLLPRMGSCEKIRLLCVENKWIVDAPQAGDVCFSMTVDGVAHHIALVTMSMPLTTIAGNTSEDGASANGDRVAEHMVSSDAKVFARIPAPLAA